MGGEESTPLLYAPFRRRFAGCEHVLSCSYRGLAGRGVDLAPNRSFTMNTCARSPKVRDMAEPI